MHEEFAIATEEDIPALVALVNSAYRGESSKRGWTTEADLLGGIRTDEQSLQETMEQPDTIILKYAEDGQILGCVYLQKQGTLLYLGMLTVAPQLQAKGIGKKLMLAAESYARQVNCTAIIMTVISVRAELIGWYQRRGYYLTGETRPFVPGEHFGIQKQSLEFVVMRKEIGD